MTPKRRIDLQTKIVFVLISILVPFYLISTIVQYQLIRPLLEQQLRQVGVTTGEALAAEIMSGRLLNRTDAATNVERLILERIYLQPSVIRMDVYVKDGEKLKLLTSSIDEDHSEVPPSVMLQEKEFSQLVTKAGDEELSYWEVLVPIRSQGGLKKPLPKPIGMVRTLVSTRSVTRVQDTLWPVTGISALVSIVALVFLLNFFLRKTIANERLLHKAESQNIELSERLHETQRQMMNVEKLAVMGELTANFAHEIGTPLNAMGGHLQLLKEELPQTGLPKRSVERLDIISDQTKRIEEIVKNFLHTTAKPNSQRQLVDLNTLVDRTIEIVKPRLDEIGVELRYDLDRSLGPLRVVPVDIEQILLNLANNALDSMEAKRLANADAKLRFKIRTLVARRNGKEWASVTLHDSGVGIRKTDLRNITKPFFTTKSPGQGTGLGLTICQQLAGKYGGVLDIDSKEGAWAQFTLRLPYQAGA